ncbi:unnamed protein product [Camellia sinensis]
MEVTPCERGDPHVNNGRPPTSCQQWKATNHVKSQRMRALPPTPLCINRDGRERI